MLKIEIVGFKHEHIRYDRDDYVEIDMKKVGKLNLTKQFNLGAPVSNQRVDSVGYDYESVMHYPAGENLMRAKLEPVDTNTERMGWYFLNGDGMSPKDKQKLINLYKNLPSGKYLDMNCVCVLSNLGIELILVFWFA